MQEAVSERDPGLIYLAVDPVFAALHSDARFQEIERRVGLPARVAGPEGEAGLKNRNQTPTHKFPNPTLGLPS